MTDAPVLLVLAVDQDPQLERLAGVAHQIARTAEEAASLARSAQILLHWSGPRALLEAALAANPALRWIHSRNAGVDALLFPELVASAVPLTNGSGVFSESLGEFALAMILYFAKDFPRMLANRAARRWQCFDVEEIAGQSVGILGYGDIGRAVARRTHAMGMRTLAWKRRAPREPDAQIEAYFYGEQGLREMLPQCDYVVVSAPLTPETRHRVSVAELAMLRRSAVLINVGRGPVVDQAALVEALSSGRIKGAGLDVFEVEPIPADDPVWALDNLFISPHTADHTRRWLDEAMAFFLTQYERYRSGSPLANLVDKQAGY